MTERVRMIIPAVIAAFLGYVILDFLTHAVILASWWRATETFWLPPEELFRRIPVGYLSFFVYCVSLTLLLVLLYRDRPDVAAGIKVGIIVGVLYGLTSSLCAYSVFRVPPSFLLVFPVSAIVGSTGAGAAAGWVLVGERRWRRVGLVLGLAVVLFVLGVVAQNLLPGQPTTR